LTLRAGTDGDIVVGLVAGSSSNRLGNILIESANDVTLNAVTAQSLIQSNGTNNISDNSDLGTTTLNGAVDTNTLSGVSITTMNVVVNATITTTSLGPVSLLAAAPGAATVDTGIIVLNDPGRIVSSGDVLLTALRTATPAIYVYESSYTNPGLIAQTRDFITTTSAGADVLLTSSMLFSSPGESADNDFIINTKAANGNIT
ncbi:MAG: hypothetical protein ACKPJD_38410, partial [Planctomycetaceae bacterium]